MSRDNTNEEIMRSMRMMAWARSKGELRSMGATYWGEFDKFKALDQVVEEFIKKITDEGLAE